MQLERVRLDYALGALDGDEDRRDVDATMFGGERTEPPSGLRELPLAAGAVPATGVVPGHGDMDEALEEVLLGRVGHPPGILERLVRLEVLPALDQIETLM